MTRDNIPDPQTASTFDAAASTGTSATANRTHRRCASTSVCSRCARHGHATRRRRRVRRGSRRAGHGRGAARTRGRADVLAVVRLTGADGDVRLDHARGTAPRGQRWRRCLTTEDRVFATEPAVAGDHRRPGGGGTSRDRSRRRSMAAVERRSRPTIRRERTRCRAPASTHAFRSAPTACSCHARVHVADAARAGAVPGAARRHRPATARRSLRREPGSTHGYDICDHSGSTRNSAATRIRRPRGGARGRTASA